MIFISNFIKPSDNLPPYIAFPRFLLDYKLSSTAKIVYTILLDRTRLSMKNDGWIDDQGKVYINFTIENLSKTVGKSETTIKNCLSALEQQGLIQRKRQGLGLPNYIFVKFPKDDSSSVDINKSVGKTENEPSNGTKSGATLGINVSTSNKKNSYIKIDNKEIYGRYQNVYLSQDDIQELKSTVLNWQEYIERLSNYMNSSGKKYNDHLATIKNWASKDRALVKKRDYECEQGDSL